MLVTVWILLRLKFIVSFFKSTCSSFFFKKGTNSRNLLIKNSGSDFLVLNYRLIWRILCFANGKRVSLDESFSLFISQSLTFVVSHFYALFSLFIYLIAISYYGCMDTFFLVLFPLLLILCFCFSTSVQLTWSVILQCFSPLVKVGFGPLWKLAKKSNLVSLHASLSLCIVF